MKKYNLDNEVLVAIEENMDEQEIRDMVIEEALEKKEIEKAIKYTKDGIELFIRKNYAGTVAKYEEKLLKIYKNNKMNDEYLTLLWQLYRKYFSSEYYDLLKKQYSKEEWKEEFLKIIDEIKTKKPTDSFTYNTSIKLADIYKKEKCKMNSLHL